MTDRQMAYIRRLMGERDLANDARDRLAARLDENDLATGEASQVIDWLLAQPVLPVTGGSADRSGLDLTTLSSGRYAVGDVLFRISNIDAEDGGKWAGWVFVANGSEYVDERFGSQRPGGTYRGMNADLLAVILDDPLAAMAHYGHITDHCGVCGRRLEDEESVARGIGPVCWERIAS